jgi:hypothetical protein
MPVVHKTKIKTAYYSSYIVDHMPPGCPVEAVNQAVQMCFKGWGMPVNLKVCYLMQKRQHGIVPAPMQGINRDSNDCGSVSECTADAMILTVWAGLIFMII